MEKQKYQMTGLYPETCKLCGRDDESATYEIVRHKMINPIAHVCCSCASAVSETYEKRHGGEPSPSKKERKVVYVSAWKRKTVFERDFYRCVKCETHKNLTIDHIVPVSRGGENTVENMQTLCHSCNSSKGAR